MENFTDIEDYGKAQRAYGEQKAIKELEIKQQQARSQSVITQVQEGWNEKVEKAYDKYDDFNELVGELKPVNALSIAIMQAENGADIAYHLVKHPAEVKRLTSLDPLSQVREIGKLEVKLSQTPTPKQPSKAPAPITPVAGTAKTGEPNITDQMPFEQYMKLGHKMFRGR